MLKNAMNDQPNPVVIPPQTSQPKPVIADADWETPAVQVAQTTPTASTLTPSFRSHTQRLWVLLTLLLVVIATCVTYAWQHSEVTKLQADISKDASQITNLETQSAILHKKLVPSQPSPAAAGGGGSSGTAPTLAAALQYGHQTQPAVVTLDNGKVTINSALYAIYVGNSAFNNEGALVDVSLNNTTTSVQSYDLKDFSLQLPDGVILPLGDTYNGDNGYNGSLNPSVAPGGTMDEVLTFGPVNPNTTLGTGYLRYTSPTAGSVSMGGIAFKTPLN